MLGMSLVSGRWFEEIETPGAVLINESAGAARLRGRRSHRRADPAAVARRRTATAPSSALSRDLKYAEIDADTKPELFFHHADTPICSASRW